MISSGFPTSEAWYDPERQITNKKHAHRKKCTVLILSCQFEEKTSEISTGGCSQSTGNGNQTLNPTHRWTVEILGGKVADRRSSAAESPSVKQDEEE